MDTVLLTLTLDERKALDSALEQSGKEVLFIEAGVMPLSICRVEDKPFTIFASLSVGNDVAACVSIPADHSNDSWSTTSEVKNSSFIRGYNLAEKIKVFAASWVERHSSIREYLK